MIICSCNVFTDHQLLSVLVKAPQRLRMSQVYWHLGGSAQCGQCAHTIKRMLKETVSCATGTPTGSKRSGLSSV